MYMVDPKEVVSGMFANLTNSRACNTARSSVTSEAEGGHRETGYGNLADTSGIGRVGISIRHPGLILEDGNIPLREASGLFMFNAELNWWRYRRKLIGCDFSPKVGPRECRRPREV